MQVQTLSHLRIYGADEYDFNVFVFENNYQFSGQKNKKVEDYHIFDGDLDYVSTKLVYAQVKELGDNKSKILPNNRYSVEFKIIKDISLIHHILEIGIINLTLLLFLKFFFNFRYFEYHRCVRFESFT